MPREFFDTFCCRDVLGELAGLWTPRAGDQTGSYRAQGLFSTNRSEHSWVCFQKSSYLPKREKSVPRKVLEEEHFSLPLNELGH